MYFFDGDEIFGEVFAAIECLCIFGVYDTKLTELILSRGLADLIVFNENCTGIVFTDCDINRKIIYSFYKNQDNIIVLTYLDDLEIENHKFYIY